MERGYDAPSRVLAVLSDVCAQQPKKQGARLCAGLVYKRRLIAIGTNLDRSDPWQKRFGTTPMNIYLHAETMAIKRGLARIGPDSVADSTLYVCRLTQTINQRTGKTAFNWAIAKPCEGCQRAIAEYGIRRVYYTSSITSYNLWDRYTARTTQHDMKSLNTTDANIFGISQVGTH